MPDYRQADLDKARKLMPRATSKEQERIARALAESERLGAERVRREQVVPLLHVVADSEAPHG